jgi:metal-responsive CopG/Arc/MetJ family transcriptional regulator
MGSPKISLSLTDEMLERTDRLAKHGWTTRSIIRQALVEFLSKPENRTIVEPNEEVTALKYGIIKQRNPYVNPNDAAMINMVYDLQKEQSG